MVSGEIIALVNLPQWDNQFPNFSLGLFKNIFFTFFRPKPGLVSKFYWTILAKIFD